MTDVTFNSMLADLVVGLRFLVPNLWPLLFASKLLVLYFERPSAKWQIWALPIVLGLIESLLLIESFRLFNWVHSRVLPDANVLYLAWCFYFLTFALIDALALLIAKSFRPKLVWSLIAMDLAITPLVSNVMLALH